MPKSGGELWQVDDLIVDVGRQAVLRCGDPVILPQLSFKFLLALIRSSPNVLSADELMEEVWAGIFVNSETVTQRAKLLRDALGDDPRNPRYFTVRRGTGYQLVPAPVRMDARTRFTAFQTLSGAWKAGLAAAAIGLLAVGSWTAVRLGSDDTQRVTSASPRVAVLPFDNLSSDPADAFIARGISEMVLSRLSSVGGLTVIARDSALLGLGETPSTADVRRELKADFAVDGSVQKTGDTLRVICFVVNTRDGARVWSERFDWPVARIYALQDRIADRVAASLEVHAGDIAPPSPANTSTGNPDAYLAYLKGKSVLGRFTVAETDAAIEQFERATRLDGKFALAKIALFDARMQRADLRRDDLGPVRERYAPLLDEALRLQPNSGEALFAKAMWTNIPRPEKAALFRRAAALDPGNSRGLIAYAQFLAGSESGGAYEGIGDGSVTRDDESGRERRRVLARVLAVDPLNPNARFIAIMQRLGELAPEQLEREQARALELDPGNYPLAGRYATRRWMFHGESAEAIEGLEHAISTDPQNPRAPHDAVPIYLDANDPATALALAATTPATRDSTRAILAQYRGDWRSAGQAALGPRGFLFNRFQNWLWAESVRDYVLHTGQYDLGAQAIASHYGFDLGNPRTESLPQSTVAPMLAHILIAGEKRRSGERLLAQTIQWVDEHPSYGIVGVYRTKALSLMLLGQRDQALSTLKASIETGHDIRFWWYVTERDPTWSPVRDDPRFRAIAAYCRQAAGIQRTKLDALRRAGKVPARRVAGSA